MGWIGVDLDGTLAHYEPGDFARFGATQIGKPVPKMVERVRNWLRSGKEVKIFTARVSEAGPSNGWPPIPVVVAAIQAWCQEHIGQMLEVTNVKDGYMEELWDDRAVGVVKNTGDRIEQDLLNTIKALQERLGPPEGFTGWEEGTSEL